MDPSLTPPTPASDDELGFAWVMPTGLGWPGTDPNPGHPLDRVCHRLFVTGKPFDRFGFLFVQEAHGPWHWFGAFAHHRHTMFFPGFEHACDSALYGRGTQTTTQSFAFDHLTLEDTRKRWHITSLASTEHLKATATHDLGEARRLWFGLGIPSLASLRTVYERTEAHFTSPATDSDRRRRVVIAAREGVEFPLLSVPANFGPPGPGFWHFSVVVGPRGFSSYTGPDRCFPLGCPLVKPPLPPGPLNLTLRSVRLMLTDALEVEVAMMRLPGTLSTPALIVGPN